MTHIQFSDAVILLTIIATVSFAFGWMLGSWERAYKKSPKLLISKEEIRDEAASIGWTTHDVQTSPDGNLVFHFWRYSFINGDHVTLWFDAPPVKGEVVKRINNMFPSKP